jgi:hypothetical protein
MAEQLLYKNPKTGQVVTAVDEKQAQILEAGGYVKTTASEAAQDPAAVTATPAEPSTLAEQGEWNAQQAAKAESSEGDAIAQQASQNLTAAKSAKTGSTSSTKE